MSDGTGDETSRPENLRVYGRCLEMAYRVNSSPAFEDLIREIDEADAPETTRSLWRYRHVS